MHVGFAKESCQLLQQVSDVTIVTSLLGNQPQGYVFHISPAICHHILNCLLFQ